MSHAPPFQDHVHVYDGVSCVRHKDCAALISLSNSIAFCRLLASFVELVEHKEASCAVVMFAVVCDSLCSCHRRNGSNPLFSALIGAQQLAMKVKWPKSGAGYELLGPIGKGATSVVYRAKNKEANVECAVKVFNLRELPDDSEDRILKVGWFVSNFWLATLNMWV
jgi:hypothetical protein